MKRKKLTTREKIRIAKEVMARAVEISETTKADVFVEFSPHIDSIVWSVYENGWKDRDDDKVPSSHYIRFDSEYVDPRWGLQEFNREMNRLEAAE